MTILPAPLDLPSRCSPGALSPMDAGLREDRSHRVARGLRAAAFCALMIVLDSVGFSYIETASADENDCGSLDSSGRGNIGPWDYHDPSSRVPTGEDPMGRIKRVENVHFKPKWEFIDPKEPSEEIGNQTIYTLLVFPNHPRALWTLSRLEKQRGPLKNYAYHNSIWVPQLTADCFFDRAFRFRQDQSPTWMLYGMHLHSRGNLKGSKDAYRKAEELGEDSTPFHYNYGLLLADAREIDAAEAHARIAYARGYPLKGLKDRLKKLGRDIGTPAAEK